MANRGQELAGLLRQPSQAAWDKPLVLLGVLFPAATETTAGPGSLHQALWTLKSHPLLGYQAPGTAPGPLGIARWAPFVLLHRADPRSHDPMIPIPQLVYLKCQDPQGRLEARGRELEGGAPPHLVPGWLSC